jgi:hypothetical protein
VDPVKTYFLEESISSIIGVERIELRITLGGTNKTKYTAKKYLVRNDVSEESIS